MLDFMGPVGANHAADFPLRPAADPSPPKSCEDPVPVLPSEARTYAAVVAWEATHPYPPSLGELAAELAISRTAVRNMLLRLVLKGLVKRQAGEARSLHLVRPAPELRIIGRVGAGKLVEWFEHPAEILDLESLFMRPGWFLVRIDTDMFAPLHYIAGDLVVVDADGAVQGMVRQHIRPRSG